MSVLNKQIQDWDIFRQNIVKATPVNTSETHAGKLARKRKLEANPQAWKEYYFPNYFSSPSPKFHTRASRRLITNFIKNKHWYEVRHWARGLSKSTLGMMDILFLVLTGHLKNIILCSSTSDAAIAFLERYRSQLDSNQRLISDYGVQKTPGFWAADDFTTRSGTRFKALGARQSPRGNGNNEIRPDCLIIDDFDTDEECRNPDIINDKWNWYEQALFYTIDIARPYLVLWNGNIIAKDCCVVRAGKKADHTEIINIRDENGVSTWPEKNTDAVIQAAIDYTSYESSQKELFNNPLTLGQVFKEMNYGECPPLNKLDYAVIYADPAPSNKDRPSIKSKVQSSSKCVVVEGNLNGTYYLYKCWLDACTNATFVSWLYAAYAYVSKHTQAFVLIENNTLQDPFYKQVLLPLIFSMANEYGGNVLPITPDERKKPDKFVRIEGTLEPLNRLGLLVLNVDEKDNPHMQRMDTQFLSVSIHCF